MAKFRYKNCHGKKEKAGLHEVEIKALVDKAVQGDAKAFGELYNIYIDQIYAYAYYHIGSQAEAEDITGEIFVKAWSAIGRYEWRDKPFSAWLFRIARNRVIDYHRSKPQTVSLEESFLAYSDDVEAAVENKLMYQKLLKTVSQLPPDQREVIVLKFIEDLDNRQIAYILGKSEGAIRVLQMRALKTLRQSAKQEGE